MSQKYTAAQFQAKDGFYGPNQEFGGCYVPEILLPVLQELNLTFEKCKEDPEFLADLEYYRKHYIGRPSPLIFARNLTEKLGGAKIYLKNEGANHTGSHKINHCLYQGLLAKKMGKKQVICETGAGQHGLATATVCAKFGLQCKVFMGQKDIEKQYPNVFFMKQLGAEVIAVTNGSQTLVEAVDAAIGEFIQNPDSYYMLGSAVGPHPYPEIMREAQKVISQESKKQLADLEQSLPDVVIACIGGGSNAIGAFNEYLIEEKVRLIGVEAGGLSVEQTGQHASRLASQQGKIGIMQGFKSYFLLDANGQALSTRSIASGLNYPGIGPIHSYLYSIGRLEITSITDQEALQAFQLLAQTEGILAALESSHAVAQAIKLAPQMPKEKIILVNVSGRADNYLFNIAKGLQDQDFANFCQNFSLDS